MTVDETDATPRLAPQGPSRSSLYNAADMASFYEKPCGFGPNNASLVHLLSVPASRSAYGHSGSSSRL